MIEICQHFFKKIFKKFFNSGSTGSGRRPAKFYYTTLQPILSSGNFAQIFTKKILKFCASFSLTDDDLSVIIDLSNEREVTKMTKTYKGFYYKVSAKNVKKTYHKAVRKANKVTQY